MKNNLMKICCIGILLLSNPVFAACEGGDTLTASDNTVFCLSTITMNWWSAFTWCEAQGGHLASLQEIHHGASPSAQNQYSISKTYDSVLLSANQTWLSTPWGTTLAHYTISFTKNAAYVRKDNRSISYQYKALCIIP